MGAIRLFDQTKDLKVIVKLISSGYPLESGKTIDYQILTELKDAHHIWVYEDETIKGLLSTQPWMDESDTIFIKIFTDPAQRGKGVGSALWERLKQEIEQRNIRKVVSFYEENQINRSFYAQRGFRKWYGWTDMRYNGSIKLQESNLDVRTYEDRYFEQWIKGFGDAYRDLFMRAELKPEYEDIEGNRNWARENSGNLFLFYDGSVFVGSCYLEHGFISAMFVCPEYQRQGYGKRILHYVINQAQKYGSSPIRLAVLDVNAAAKSLYRGAGFEVERAFELSRLSIP